MIRKKKIQEERRKKSIFCRLKDSNNFLSMARRNLSNDISPLLDRNDKNANRVAQKLNINRWDLSLGVRRSSVEV